MKLLIVLLGLICSTSFAQAPSVDTAYTTTIAGLQGLTAINVARASRYSVVAVVTVQSPAAATFTCATTDICTQTAHGYYTGLKTALTTSNTLPAGLTVSNYYIIRLTANTYSFASSMANAMAGTAIDITDTGTGTHTSTPASLAGASLKLQGSMDNTNWVDLPIRATGDASKSASITTTANFYLDADLMNINYVRVYYTLTAGQLGISQISKVMK